MTIREIAIEVITGEYDYYGFRKSDNDLDIGQYCEASHDWDFENDNFSDDLLNGTCCTGIVLAGGKTWYDANDEDDVTEVMEVVKKAMDYNSGYDGKHWYLCGGKYAESGDDDNEYIISNDGEVFWEPANAIVVDKLK